jgi:hypothetical protein
MARHIYEAIENWAGGVVTSTTEAHAVNASPRGRNSALAVIAGVGAVPSKRKGLRTVNTTPITGTPGILGQYEFRRRSGGSVTRYHLLVSDTGRLDKVNADNTTSAADSVTAAPFTSGTYYPDFATMNNRVFMCNSQDRKWFDGTTVYGWGITAPSTAPSLAVSASAGSHNGTYEARVTFYNANTGEESSAGPTSSTAAPTNDQLDWSSIPVSADAQVTARRLYLRNTATQGYFYLAGTVANNTATTATTNVADTALITKGPDTTENAAPPSGIKYCETHQSRMFVADDTTVYYSKIGLPSAFSPSAYLSINSDDGKVIRGLLSFAGGLVVLKAGAIYFINTPDSDPNTWSVELVDASVGCAGHRSISTTEGLAFWWCGHNGPIAMGGDLRPRSIGLALIGPTLSEDNINYEQLPLIVSAVQVTQERVLFAVPGAGQTRNTIYLPYHYRLQVWEADRWEAIDACSLVAIDDSTGTPWVYAGGYEGQVFRWWDADNDGVPSGTMDGSVTAATSTTLTDSTAAFVTSGGALVERYVLAIDPAGTQVQRRRITSNTATELTVTPAWSVTPDTSWTYVVGGPQFEYDTRWFVSDLPFHRKRYRFMYVLAGSSTSAINVTLNLFLNYNATSPVKSVTVGASTTAAEWDEAEFDDAVFGDTVPIHSRTRVARKGRSWRLRIANYNADEDVVLYKVGMTGELLTDQNAA